MTAEHNELRDQVRASYGAAATAISGALPTAMC